MIIAITRSDAEKLDSDNDDSYDAIDAYPLVFNPTKEYLGESCSHSIESGTVYGVSAQ